MGSSTIRQRKDGAARCIAQIRIMQQGAAVYQESQTFDRKATAQAWIKRRETELAEPGAIAIAIANRATLKAISQTWRSELEDWQLTRQQLAERISR